VQLAIENPPVKDERVRILNQMTETHRVIDLAKMISEMTGGEIAYLKNPRNEAVENELFVKNQRFIDLGLEPTTLSQGLLKEVTDVAEKYAHRCDKSKIPCTSLWIQKTEAVAENNGLEPAETTKV